MEGKHDTPGNAGGCWPTKEQELLLRASLLNGKDAIDAWLEWKSTIDFDFVDRASQRLFPLLYRNLSLLGVKDPLMDKFKGICRLTWYRNQVLFHSVAGLLGSFLRAGIQTMILKGAAFTLLHYKDYGLRNMDDFDILVRNGQTVEATELLIGLGWTPKEPAIPFSRFLNDLWDAYSFEGPEGHLLELHRHVLQECCYESADNVFWNNAVSMKVNDVLTCTLNTTHQLLHVCIHGPRWNQMPPIRWVADTMMILKVSGDSIDWDHLIAVAKHLRVILPLKDSLIYVKNLLNAPIPAKTLSDIQKVPISIIEHMENKTRVSVPGTLSFFAGSFLRYLCHPDPVGGGLLGKLARFPRFLQYFWALDHLWQVPLHGALKAVRNRGKR